MVNIRTFQPDDSGPVCELFAAGLMAFAAEHEAVVQAYIQESLADDLADIPGHYLQESGSHFWVAEIDGQVKGMVGVQRRSDAEGELRRMSVAADTRRMGIGWKLMETVEAFCREQGYRRIILSTVTQLQPAIAMYQRFGYRYVGEEAYRMMTVQLYVKSLEAPPEGPDGGQNSIHDRPGP